MYPELFKHILNHLLSNGVTNISFHEMTDKVLKLSYTLQYSSDLKKLDTLVDYVLSYENGHCYFDNGFLIITDF